MQGGIIFLGPQFQRCQPIMTGRAGWSRAVCTVSARKEKQRQELLAALKTVTTSFQRPTSYPHLPAALWWSGAIRHSSLDQVFWFQLSLEVPSQTCREQYFTNLSSVYSISLTGLSITDRLHGLLRFAEVICLLLRQYFQFPCEGGGLNSCPAVVNRDSSLHFL